MSNQVKPLWQILEPGPKNKFPGKIHVIVEIPKNTKGKYELDKKTGALFLDRELLSAMTYPGDYGSVPQTLGQDGDPVDALILVSQPHYPGVVIPCRPIALIKMKDEKGQDNKILCVPEDKVDPNFQRIKDLKDVDESVVSEINHFFKHMKELEPDKWVEVEKWEDKKRAEKYLLESVKRYDLEFKT